MKLLLDTHALLFWLYQPERLGSEALREISDERNVVFWSVASSWEAATKVRLGKLTLDGPVAEVIPNELLKNGFNLLPIDHAHVLSVADLPLHHGDPFDRLLIAQALAEALVFVTTDRWAPTYGVQTLW